MYQICEGINSKGERLHSDFAHRAPDGHGLPHDTPVILRKLVRDRVQEIKSRIPRKLEEIITYGRDEEEVAVSLESVTEEANNYLISFWMTLQWPGSRRTCMRNYQRPWTAGSEPIAKPSSTKTPFLATTGRRGWNFLSSVTPPSLALQLLRRCLVLQRTS